MGQYRKWIAIGGGVLVSVVLAVVVTLYVLGGAKTHGGLLTRLAGGIDYISSGVKPATAEAEASFAFRRLDVDTTKNEPQACLVFTRALDATGRTQYKDYIAIDPQTRVAVHVVGERLCIAGLDFSKTYNVTLKTGLPSAGNDKLLEDETIPVELRDKPSIVQFNGGIILPRQNVKGVPLTTVNVSKVKLKLIRVGDRLLSQIESGTVDETSLYSWSANEIQNNQGSLIWQGTVDVANVKNNTVVTLIPIDDVLKNRKPGAYVLIASDAAKKKATADDDEDYDYSSGELAVQWVVDSDMALTTFKGAGGLSVFVRSYASAKPMSGIKLSLVARNNNLLASVNTNSDGRADFDAGLLRAKGGDEPVVVMAYGDGGDFSFIDLRRSAFDLTDRGVGGREVPGPLDAYLYTERGVYRPGEAVYLTAMLRDRVGAAATAPLTLVATRPDGLEVGRTTIPGQNLQAGAATWKLPLSSSAPHGRWQIAAYVDTSKDADPVGRVQFDVQDFVPQKLKVTLTTITKSVKPGGDIKVKAESRFLYGAPASGLTGESEARITTDPRPFDDYKGWQFGRMDDKFSDVDVQLTVPPTDAAGVTTVSGTVNEVADTTLPLKAMIRVAIHEPGGRTTAKTTEIPVRNHEAWIGIDPQFDGSVAEGQPASFRVIALDGDGKRIALDHVTYSFVREDTSYQWYQDEGNWKYKSTTRDRLVTSGTMRLSLGAPVAITQRSSWGTYRLTITDPASGTSSSYRYYSGWAASSAGDRPDRIPVAADKPSYRAGETAHVRIKPTANGKALVVVAADKIFSSKTIDAPAGGTTVDIPVSSDWGAGAYVLVTDYRPLNEASGHEPVRSVGLVWLSLDNAPRTLTTLIGGPKKIVPRQKLNLPIVVKGLSSGEQAWLTLAAVDEGILQLTDYKSPDPNAYYFGKRRLGVEMRDDYGRLIKAERGAIGPMREGGDMFGGRSLAVVPVKTVSLFSGLVKIGANGMVSIPLDVPDFNGELRLMAVAMSSGKLGRADRALTVRDAVVADIVLPRFLAPGDRAQAALNLNNVEGRPGNYVATVTAFGPVGLAQGNQTVITQNLTAGKRVLVPVDINGRGVGIATISLKLTGPAGFNVTHSWQMEVRSPQMDIARDETLPLNAGASFTANKALVADIVPGTATVSLTVSAGHGFANVPGLLKWLDKYPYGCIEQTSSGAMPLLFFNDLADLAGLPRDNALRQREQHAVDRVLDMQNPGGNFGMWGPGNDAEPFISAYALDFLMMAKDKGYVVPNDALRRGMAWLRRTASSNSQDDATRAYAFYLLARAGQVNISDLRYFSDTRGPEWKTVMPAALTGAAASEVGDRSRTVYGFNRARDIAFKMKPSGYPYDDYGSYLRDLAAATALAAESGMSPMLPAFLSKVEGIDMRLNWTTTQEKAWILRAAYELTRQKTRLNILVNGQPAQLRNNAVRLKPDYGQLDRGITFTNRGDAVVWRTVSVQGTPASPLPPVSNGITLAKAAWTLSGSPADLGNLHQNDRIIIELSGRLSNNYARQIGMIDLLPAGFEIEQTLKGDEGKPYNLNGTLTDLSIADKRDDRYVAAFTLGSRYGHYGRENDPQAGFRAAYVVRAVGVGTFVMPAATVEDMYAPGVMARTAMGTVTIKP